MTLGLLGFLLGVLLLLNWVRVRHLLYPGVLHSGMSVTVAAFLLPIRGLG